MSNSNFAAYEEDGDNLEADWRDCTDMFCAIVGDKKEVEDWIANVPVYWREGLIKSDKGTMLGATRLDKLGELYVLISTAADEDDDTYFNALFHEMCHVWSYFKYGDLDATHTKGWKIAANRLNKKIKGKKLTATC